MGESVVGQQVMVVSPHHLASEAGAGILQKGGNAFDAAVAVSACLAVVYPHMTGLGGDSFWLMYNAEEEAIRGYNASGRSGHLATREVYGEESQIPIRGARSVLTVPGMVDGWATVVQEYGRLSLAEVLEPAITYAKQGFPMSLDQYEGTLLRSDVLEGCQETAAIYLPGGSAVLPGENFVQRELGETLTAIAREGRDAFYKGAVAEEICSALQNAGGLLTLQDLAEHRGDWVQPIEGSYRGYQIYQMPPNSQGFVGITTLQALEHFDVAAIPHGSAEYYHLMVEAIKLNFRDRDTYLSDPDFTDIPLEELLSKERAAGVASQINRSKASSLVTQPLGSDTAYAAVIDEDGNAVSFIQSLYFEFGSGVVAGNTGVLMQNRGSFFSLNPNHVNTLEPRKRTFHTLMPAMACLHGKPAILYGTQGGEGQPQTQTALITRIVDYGMEPQQAIDEPRWLWGRTWGDHSQELRLEGRVSDNIAAELTEMGHLARRVKDYDGVMGHAHVITIGTDGTLKGGTDPRCDGKAVGW